MTIPDEAVQAAARALCRFGTSFSTIEATNSCVDEKWTRYKEEAALALTAAAPFLQGVKVEEIRAIAEEFINEGSRDYPEEVCRSLKAMGQRLLSAIEVSPPPRAQALEEAAKEQLLKDADWLGEYGHQLSEEECEHHDGGYTANRLRAIGERIDAAIRTLSSQHVADGWLPIGKKERAKALAVSLRQCSIFVAADVGKHIAASMTDAAEFLEALPSSPGASVTRPTGGSDADA